MPTTSLTNKLQEEEKKEEHKIIIPGIQDISATNQKKLVVVESDKYIPNCEVTDDAQSVVFVFSVPEEESAKDFEIDLC